MKNLRVAVGYSVNVRATIALQEIPLFAGHCCGSKVGPVVALLLLRLLGYFENRYTGILCRGRKTQPENQYLYRVPWELPKAPESKLADTIALKQEPRKTDSGLCWPLTAKANQRGPDTHTLTALGRAARMQHSLCLPDMKWGEKKSRGFGDGGGFLEEVWGRSSEWIWLKHCIHESFKE